MEISKSSQTFEVPKFTYTQKPKAQYTEFKGYQFEQEFSRKC